MKADLSTRNAWILRRHNMPYEERLAEDRSNRALFERGEDGGGESLTLKLPPLHLLYATLGAETVFEERNGFVWRRQGQALSLVSEKLKSGGEPLPIAPGEDLEGAVRAAYKQACNAEAGRQWVWSRTGEGRRYLQDNPPRWSVGGDGRLWQPRAG